MLCSTAMAPPPKIQNLKSKISTVGFALGAYDPAYPLVIDPLTLAYGTFLGGSSYDTGTGIAVDSAGAAYVTGYISAPISRTNLIASIRLPCGGARVA